MYVWGLAVVLRFGMRSMLFLQAEDGIRDLVRSRGLGDVYKRQGEEAEEARHVVLRHGAALFRRGARAAALPHRRGTVSYTHLTLPTSDLV